MRPTLCAARPAVGGVRGRNVWSGPAARDANIWAAGDVRSRVQPDLVDYRSSCRYQNSCHMDSQLSTHTHTHTRTHTHAHTHTHTAEHSVIDRILLRRLNERRQASITSTAHACRRSPNTQWLTVSRHI
ncbi:hypothetical protein EVAR_102923_1 [Eumeta japonica]|uniref:Uncharacterized protein n=1 Tax=Eumeta variegata TaxID=151549 RepID=A0A4C2A0M1_EUMVA|nr:hypothetical protein EVAR_102923_1 [Eumeta japonica]